MDLQTPTNNAQSPNPEEDPSNQEGSTQFFDDMDSNCSTPYVSAPSSPGRGPISGFFYSAPASPLHFAITAASHQNMPSSSSSVPMGYEFEFSARFGSSGSSGPGSMSSADELFLNGKIRPMKLSTHLERPQVLTPLLDLEEEEEEEDVVVLRGRDLRLRDKSIRRRTRSMSPLRSNTPLEWVENEDHHGTLEIENQRDDDDNNNNGSSELENNEREKVDVSGSSSRSSSAGRSSKRWVFLKDFLRSKSEGRSNNKFWSTISFSPIKDKKATSSTTNLPKEKSKGGWGKKIGGKPTNGVVGKRRVVPPSPHELHYKANRAQAEELRKKTFLPYRQGLFGCLGFTSKGYGAMNGLARALNPVSSR